MRRQYVEAIAFRIKVPMDVVLTLIWVEGGGNFTPPPPKGWFSYKTVKAVILAFCCSIK